MAERKDSPDLRLLEAILLNRAGRWTDWRKINAASSAHTPHGKGWGQRTIAELAKDSGGSIIGTTRGYKLSKTATDEDILYAYSIIMKKALGSEKRARDIIAYARQHGRLGDRNLEHQARRKIQDELGFDPDPAPAQSATPELDLDDTRLPPLDPANYQ